MFRIHVRDLLKYSTDALWDSLTGNIVLIFDDNSELYTNYKEVIISRYFWELFNLHPNIEIKPKHFITSGMNNGMLIKNTHNKVLSNIMPDIILDGMKNSYAPQKVDRLCKLMFEIINKLYNDIITRIDEYALTVDILDFINIQTNKSISNAMDDVSNNPNKNTIDDAYNIITRVIDEEISADNNLTKAFRTGVVNRNQVLQCIGPRGYITEINGEVFKHPVTKSYTLGMGNLYNVAVESRSGAKALYLSDNALKNSEYFRRRLEILTLLVDKINYHDCGSTDYLIWNVKPPVKNKFGKTTYCGDLKLLIGKHYLDPDTNELKVISKNDTHLNNRTIKIRDSIYCRDPDPHAVCSTCYGETSKNMGIRTNVGNYLSTDFVAKISQAILSAKHLDFSSIVNDIKLSEVARTYFKLTRDNNGYILKPNISKLNPKLYIAATDATGINDIDLVGDIHRIAPSRISKINTALLEYTERGDTKHIPIDLYQQNRKAMLSTQMLAHIKENRYEVDNNGNYVIDLHNWNYSNVMFILPMIEYSFSDYRIQISKLLESVNKLPGIKRREKTPEIVLIELFDLVNSKLEIPLSALGLIIYAITSKDPYNGDYSLSRNSETAIMDSGPATIENRSLSAVYSYEEQHKIMLKPSSFLKRNRPDHPFDSIVKPNDSIKGLNRHKKI